MPLMKSLEYRWAVRLQNNCGYFTAMKVCTRLGYTWALINVYNQLSFIAWQIVLHGEGSLLR